MLTKHFWKMSPWVGSDKIVSSVFESRLYSIAWAVVDINFKGQFGDSYLYLETSYKTNNTAWKHMYQTCSKHPRSPPECKIQSRYYIGNIEFFLLLDGIVYTLAPCMHSDPGRGRERRGGSDLCVACKGVPGVFYSAGTAHIVPHCRLDYMQQAVLAFYEYF